MILHLLLLSEIMDECKYNNDDDENDGVTDHDYRVGDRSIAVIGSGER